MALRGADGAVFAWGFNGSGQLGNGTSGSNSSLPVQVLTPSGTCCLTGIKTITAGATHCLARKSNKSVLAWGNDSVGQLGDGNPGTISTIPVGVLGLSATTAIGAGDSHSLAVKSGGTAWAWGAGGQGQLGDNSFNNASAPVEVVGVGGSGVLTGITAITGGSFGFHSLARRSDGKLFAWGLNVSGQLGDGTTTERLVPVQVKNLTGMTGIAAGRMHSLALKP